MATLKKNEPIAHYAGNFIPAQIEKAWIEQGGEAWLKPEIPGKK
jgi:hypothetical protein